MLWTPGWGLLTALLFDSIELINEKTGGVSEKDRLREIVESRNRMLNNDIRKTKEKYGVMMADMALRNIETHINVVNKNAGFQYAKGEIVLEEDNINYIVELLRKCAGEYYERSNEVYAERKFKLAEEYKEKALKYQMAYETILEKTKEKNKEIEDKEIAKKNNIWEEITDFIYFFAVSGAWRLVIGLLIIIAAAFVLVNYL